MWASNLAWFIIQHARQQRMLLSLNRYTAEHLVFNMHWLATSCCSFQRSGQFFWLTGFASCSQSVSHCVCGTCHICLCISCVVSALASFWIESPFNPSKLQYGHCRCQSFTCEVAEDICWHGCWGSLSLSLSLSLKWTGYAASSNRWQLSSAVV